MPTFIITGSYTSQGMKGLVDHPSDREAAAREIVEASGGILKSYYLTSGGSDFMVIVEAADSADLVAGLLVSGASGTLTGLKTIRAYTNAEFNTIQKKAKALAGKYSPPDKA